MSAVFSVIGAVLGFIGQSKEEKEARKAEQARRRQMQLESMRRKREMIRAASRARAEATNAAVSQGAGGSSGLQGGLAGVQNQLGGGLLANRQDTILANRVFDANIAASKARGFSMIGEAIGGFAGVFGSENFARYTS